MGLYYGIASGGVSTVTILDVICKTEIVPDASWYYNECIVRELNE